MIYAALVLLQALVTDPVAAGSPAAHATPTAQPATAPAPQSKDDNRRICRRESVTGSLAGGKKTCRTRAEWRELDAESKSSVRDFQNERKANSTIGG